MLRKVKETNSKHISQVREFYHPSLRQRILKVYARTTPSLLSVLPSHEISVTYEYPLISPGTWSRQLCTPKGTQRTTNRDNHLCLSSPGIHLLRVLGLLSVPQACRHLSCLWICHNICLKPFVISSLSNHSVFDMIGFLPFNSQLKYHLSWLPFWYHQVLHRISHGL